MASAAALGPYERASALSCKSEELLVRGHDERSDVKLREALAAARAVGTEDCLFTAFLTVELVHRDLFSLLRLAREQPTVFRDRMSAAGVADRLCEFVDAITDAAAVARRRRLAGMHQPAEQAWFVAFNVAAFCVTGNAESKALFAAKRMASICSETTLLAACESLHLLQLATRLELFIASEFCSRLEATCDLVDEAVALCGPQRVKDTYNVYAGRIKSHLRAGIELWRQQSSTAALAERLAEALEELSLHGAESAEDAQYDQGVKKENAKVDAARVAASAPELLRRCALASCGALEAHVRHFSRCSACKTVVYCSKTCQLADWPAHKKAGTRRTGLRARACKALRRTMLSRPPKLGRRWALRRPCLLHAKRFTFLGWPRSWPCSARASYRPAWARHATWLTKLFRSPDRSA